jgi:hypothetical protein
LGGYGDDIHSCEQDPVFLAKLPLQSAMPRPSTVTDQTRMLNEVECSMRFDHVHLCRLEFWQVLERHVPNSSNCGLRHWPV